jgi:hypothetical protein
MLFGSGYMHAACRTEYMMAVVGPPAYPETLQQLLSPLHGCCRVRGALHRGGGGGQQHGKPTQDVTCTHSEQHTCNGDTHLL